MLNFLLTVACVIFGYLGFILGFELNFCSSNKALKNWLELKINPHNSENYSLTIVSLN